MVLIQMLPFVGLPSINYLRFINKVAYNLCVVYHVSHFIIDFRDFAFITTITVSENQH